MSELERRLTEARIKVLTDRLEQSTAALEWITRCAKMNGPAGTTAYIIGDEHMAKVRDAIAKARGE